MPCAGRPYVFRVMQAVELIPVLDIGYHSRELPAPELYPREQHAAAWDEYAVRSHALAGFPEPLRPFARGLHFYRAVEVGPGNLQKVLTDHLAGYLSGEWSLAETPALYGGYVLRLDGQNALFPQCYGELSDIIYWKRLTQGHSAPYQGHPAPNVTFSADEVILDCHVRNDYDEPFEPVAAPEIRVNRQALAAAYQRAVEELHEFARHLEQARQALALPLGDLSNLLIFRNAEIPDEQH